MFVSIFFEFLEMVKGVVCLHALVKSNVKVTYLPEILVYCDPVLHIRYCHMCKAFHPW